MTTQGEAEFTAPAVLLEQERALRLDHTDEVTCYRIGSWIAERSLQASQTVTVVVVLHGRTVYKAALPGTSAGNDMIIEGKARSLPPGPALQPVRTKPLPRRGNHVRGRHRTVSARVRTVRRFRAFGIDYRFLRGTGRRVRPQPRRGPRPRRGRHQVRATTMNSEHTQVGRTCALGAGHNSEVLSWPDNPGGCSIGRYSVGASKARSGVAAADTRLDGKTWSRWWP